MNVFACACTIAGVLLKVYGQIDRAVSWRSHGTPLHKQGRPQ
jgi:hypothetical protein